ncbi:hypothetical protein EVAR_56857_1 [Eumeta japonica]|uniref:Uncharacterized protein n=1 Tax=Eumeta variegata TaxID=151549 RepID=A0A4C1YTJ8_EUMVA|nr:hypothetical protein EVAR_56857_1 [Eumeta japonica]
MEIQHPPNTESNIMEGLQNCSRVGCVRPLSLFFSDASADGVEERYLSLAPQAERLGRSCLSIACSALSLAHSAQAERDNAFSCVQQAFIDL